MPPLAVVTAVVLGFTWGVSWIRWVGLNVSPSADVVSRLLPYLFPYALLGLRRRLRSRLIAGFVVVDVIVFTILAVVQVGPGPFAGAGSSPG